MKITAEEAGRPATKLEEREAQLRSIARMAGLVVLHEEVDFDQVPERIGAKLAQIDRLEDGLRRIARYLDIPLNSTANDAVQAIRKLQDALGDAVQDKSPGLVRHAPWNLAGTPGSTPPDYKGKDDDEPLCLARVVVDDEVIWVFAEWMRLSKHWVDTADGDPVEVLEYWVLPPSGEGWERTWKRKL